MERGEGFGDGGRERRKEGDGVGRSLSRLAFRSGYALGPYNCIETGSRLALC